MSDNDGTGHVGRCDVSGGEAVGANLPDDPTRGEEERPAVSEAHLPWFMWMPISSTAASPRGRVINTIATQGQCLQQQQYQSWYTSAEINLPTMSPAEQAQEYSPTLSRFLPPPVDYYTMQLAQHYYRQQHQQLSYSLGYTYIAPPISISPPATTSEFRMPQLPIPRQKFRQQHRRQKRHEPPPNSEQMHIPPPQVEPYNLTMIQRDKFSSSSAQIDMASPINIQHQQLSAPQTEPYDLSMRHHQFSPRSTPITEDRQFLTPEVEKIKISREQYEQSWEHMKGYIYARPRRRNPSPVPPQLPTLTGTAATQVSSNVIVINCTTEETAIDILRQRDYLNEDHARKRHLYAQLCTMVPGLQGDPINIRRNKVRRKTAQYIQQGHQTFKELNNQMGDLITERDELRDTLKRIHGFVGMSLPPDFRQLYDLYDFRNKYYLNACYRIEENWKFWIFSLILDPLAMSYNCAVPTDGSQDIGSAALAWIDNNYSLTELNEIISSKLADVASSTNMPSDWVATLLAELARASDNATEEHEIA